MRLIKAFTGSIESTLADQWIEIITAGKFDEHLIFAPGIILNREENTFRKNIGGVITNGSKIYVPENTAAVIFNESAIEEIITEPGGYIYNNGEESVFNTQSVDTLIDQVAERFVHGGTSPVMKRIGFVNLREIRDIRYGTKGPQIYHDEYYDVDLEILSHGSLSVKVTDVETLINNFIPANAKFYSFEDSKVRAQVVAEFIQSFMTALNELSNQYRISQLPSHSFEINEAIKRDENHVGSWGGRFGFELSNIAIENIELSDSSKELVKQFAAKKMDLKVYENITQKASDIAAQQKIAEGIQSHGLGDGAGVIVGMSSAQTISNNIGGQQKLSLDEQIELVRKLKALVDEGILSPEEFELKKKEVMGL